MSQEPSQRYEVGDRVSYQTRPDKLAYLGTVREIHAVYRMDWDEGRGKGEGRELWKIDGEKLKPIKLTPEQKEIEELKRELAAVEAYLEDANALIAQQERQLDFRYDTIRDFLNNEYGDDTDRLFNELTAGSK